MNRSSRNDGLSHLGPFENNGDARRKKIRRACIDLEPERLDLLI